MLNAIYETDFLGFSYGFRPGRSAHQALDALTVGIMTKKVNWALDAVRETGDLRLPGLHAQLREDAGGKFTVLRQTMRKRLRAKLKEVKAELRRRMHDPIPEQGAYLGAVLRGHFR